MRSCTKIILCLLLTTSFSWSYSVAQKVGQPVPGTKGYKNLFDQKKLDHTKPRSEASLKYERRRGVSISPGSPNSFLSTSFDLEGSQNHDGYTLKEVYRQDNRRLPIFISTEHRTRESLSTRSDSELSSVVYEHIKDLKKMLPFSSPEKELAIKKINRDDKGFVHVRLQQQFKGLPILGAEAILHFSSKGQRVLNGQLEFPIKHLSVEPKLTAEEAIQIVSSNMGEISGHHHIDEHSKEYLDYHQPQSKLLIYPHPTEPEVYHLAYEIETYANIKDHIFFYVDAHTGEVINKVNHTCTFIPPTQGSSNDLLNSNVQLNTFQEGNTFVMLDASQSMFQGAGVALPQQGEGSIVTLDLRNDIEGELFLITSGDNNNWDPTAVSAHNNATTSYLYYESVHNHISIDGQGGDMLSIINFPDPETGGSFDNAFWNGRFIGYGNGGQVSLLPLSAALDVAAHEMTHGVIEATANLEYQGQSGALNESFADVFGVLIEREDFLLGEDIINRQIFPSGALRDVANPNNGSAPGSPGWQPKDMNEFQNLPPDVDNGGVHVNSGIPNRAFAIFTNEVGADKSEDVYYRALTQYLTRRSQFIDCRLAVIQAATDLFGANSAEVQAASNAFDAVGLFGEQVDPETTPDPGEGRVDRFEVNTGTKFILHTNTNPSDPNTLYSFDVQSTEFFPVSTTPHIRPVSVSDDGLIGIMIDTDRQIRLLGLDLTNPIEEVVEVDLEWSNAVMSKDGTKLAAVTNEEDATIWILDLVNEGVMAFELFNPTTSELEIGTNEVLFADALEWDHTSQILMYDALNRRESIFGEGIEYWDIGFIDVWDNETNSFGTGNIIKLFSNRPEDISVGNATFSETSPQIIAFDLVDDSDNSMSLYTANIETGDLVEIFNNQVLGFPSFAPDDNTLYFSALDENGSELVASVDLGDDDITPINGTLRGVLATSQWPEAYATGERDLSGPVTTTNNKNDLTIAEGVEVYPNPSNGTFTLAFSLTESAEVQVWLSDLTGKQVKAFNTGELFAQGNHSAQYSMNELPSGLYLLEMRSGNKRITKKIVKQ